MSKPYSTGIDEPLSHSQHITRRETQVFRDGLVGNTYTHGNVIETDVKSHAGLFVPTSQRLRMSVKNNDATSAATFTDGIAPVFSKLERDVAGINVESIENLHLVYEAQSGFKQSTNYRAGRGAFGMGVGAVLAGNGSRYFELDLAEISGMSKMRRLFANKYLANGERLRLTVGPVNQGTVSAADNDRPLEITDVSFVCDVVYLQEAMDKALKMVIENSDTKIVYPVDTFVVRSEAVSAGASAKNVSFNHPCSYLKSVMLFNNVAAEQVATQGVPAKLPSWTPSNAAIYWGSNLLAGNQYLRDIYSIYNHTLMSYGNYPDLGMSDARVTTTQYSRDLCATAANDGLYVLRHSFAGDPEFSDDLHESVDNTANLAIISEFTAGAVVPASARHYCAFEVTKYIVMSNREVKVIG